MKKIYSALSWFFALFLLPLSLVGMSQDGLSAAPLLGISLLLLPPFRRFVYARTEIAIPAKVRAGLIAALLVTAGVAIDKDNDQKALVRQEQEAQKLAKAKDDEQKKLALTLELKDKKAKILEDARKLLQAKDYKSVIATTSPYLVTDDQDVFKINAQARNELANIEIAAAEKKRKADEHEEKIKKQFSAWGGSHIAVEKFIKESMHNPDSYQHVETRYADRGDHLIISTKFRGTNGFGGVVTNSRRARVSIDGDAVTFLD